VRNIADLRVRGFAWTRDHPPNHQHDQGANYCTDETGAFAWLIPAEGLSEISGHDSTNDP